MGVFKQLASLAVIAAIPFVSASGVLDLTPTNFNAEIIDSGVPSLVEFFAPWCGHCKKLAPTYDELADSFGAALGKTIKVAKVDADEHKSLGTEFGVSGFPTIKFFDGKSKTPQDYKGGRDLDSLQAYITEQTGVRPKKAAAGPSSLVHYTDKTFDAAVTGDKGVFVAFTAPWCGHCKTLAPTWEKVAADFALDGADVVIAKVDAEANKAIAAAQGIKSFPTIKYFPKGGAAPLEYGGGRAEADLVAYVNAQAGTHRVAGGGLDALAGTVQSLDDLVKDWAGSDLAGIAAKVTAAVASVQDVGADYYSKVLAKLAENKDYVAKETGRLQGLLTKGGLAREKEDEMTRKLNVLKKFVLGDKKSEL